MYKLPYIFNVIFDVADSMLLVNAWFLKHMCYHVGLIHPNIVDLVILLLTALSGSCEFIFEQIS